jgi:ParB family chromosome partitioning protein
MNQQRKGGLGRGLAALIPPGERDGASLQELPLSAITPNPRQPRGVFDPEELEGLATSIRDMGVLQPIVVRPLGDERFELVAGERRLRASKMAGLTRIPAVIRQTEDEDLLKEALVENIHRVQLNPLEEAAAYQQLLDDFDFTQEELATRIGKSRPAISNSLRLLTLSPPLQRKVAAGVLSAGHAKALLAVDDRAEQERLADKIVNEGLSVRATEELIRFQLMEDEAASSGLPGPTRSSGSGASTSPSRRRVTAPGLIELQEDLSDALMARVKISMGSRKGKVQIEFGSVDDLERIVGVIARGLGTDVTLGSAQD